MSNRPTAAQVMGVARYLQDARALLVFFDRPPTDDELRATHEALRRAQERAEIAACAETPEPGRALSESQALRAIERLRATSAGELRDAMRRVMAQQPDSFAAPITRAAGSVPPVLLRGTAEEVAHQFHRHAVGPVLQALAAGPGTVGLNDFLAALVTLLSIDAHDMLGPDHAMHLVALVQSGLQVRALRDGDATRGH